MSNKIHKYDSHSNCYNFFFHPLHREKEQKIKTFFAVITHVFLTAISVGLWEIPFCIVNKRDSKKMKVHKNENPKINRVAGNTLLKNETKKAQTSDSKKKQKDLPTTDNSVPTPPITGENAKLILEEKPTEAKPEVPNKEAEQIAETAAEPRANSDVEIKNKEKDADKEPEKVIPRVPSATSTTATPVTATPVLPIPTKSIEQRLPLDLTLEDELELLSMTSEKLEALADAYKPFVLQKNVQAICILAQIRILQAKNEPAHKSIAYAVRINSDEVILHLQELEQISEQLKQQVTKMFQTVISCNAQELVSLNKHLTRFSAIHGELCGICPTYLEKSGKALPIELMF